MRPVIALSFIGAIVLSLVRNQREIRRISNRICGSAAHQSFLANIVRLATSLRPSIYMAGGDAVDRHR